MRDTILNFPNQLTANLEIVHREKLAGGPPYVVAGMGGSALAPGILFTYDPSYDIVVHRDYDLPHFSEKKMDDALIILSSYSGDTEEPLSTYHKAQDQGLNRCVVASGGKLLELAQSDGVPHIQIPESNLPPRLALGYSVKALAALMSDDQALKDLEQAARVLDPMSYEEAGAAIAREIKDHVPVIYSSTRNKSIAYNWKIKFNETGKVPAFMNVLPEANHNEMDAFDVRPTTAHLSQNQFVILLHDHVDDERVQHRMRVMAELLRDRNVHVRVLELGEGLVFEKIFRSLLIADWASYHLAQAYGLEPDPVPMIEEFKKRLTDFSKLG